MRHPSRALLVVVAGLSAMAVVLPARQNEVSDRARTIHMSAFVVDTHVDVPNLLRADWRFGDEHADDHVDLPRMRKGGLDAAFFSIYMAGTVTGPRAVNEAMERIAAVHDLADSMPDQLVLCTTVAEVDRARRSGKVAILMGMEGGHMINNSLPLLRTYARLGVRYLSLTHNVNTDWADSVGDRPVHDGLTSFGREVVLELNRLGVMVDISHAADKTFWDALATSRAPMIASHSSIRGLARHPRNLTDEMITALAAKGGVIQITFANTFLDTAIADHTLRTARRSEELAAMFTGPGGAAEIRQRLNQELGPRPQTDWQRIVDHIDHAVKLVGADHVGLGSDFDGATMPAGMDDVTRLPRITEALLSRGYRESDIRKILGQNTLRLMRDVERVAESLRQAERERR